LGILKDYQGREVLLTDERLSHITEHREMIGLEALLEKALLHPDLVIQSLSDSQVVLYYHLLAESRLGVNWLCVVVKLLASDAFVLTAYLTDKPKKGLQQWPNT
jgi:hypothetical protein